MPYMVELDIMLPLIVSGRTTLLMLGASAFETPVEGNLSPVVGTALKTGPNAYLRNFTGDSASTGIEKQPGDRTGELSLALYANRTHANGTISRLFACGNSGLFADASLYQDTYSQEFLIQVLSELVPQNAISLDIMASTAIRPGLRLGSQSLGIALIVSIPLLALACALFILLPRGNR
jgi:hypothetical protein